ncbi:DNA endonuclease SmrA [Aliikangiella sp. IMCC44653]
MPDSSNDNSDFFAEMSDVKPLKQDKIVAHDNKGEQLNVAYRQKVAQSFGQKDRNFLTDGEVPSVEPLEILSFKLDGVQPGVFKKLRQGKYQSDCHLDLHRKTVAEARNEVFQLLKLSNQKAFRCITITHGKGMLSNPPARLKSYVYHWLKQVDTVIAFHSSPPQHGGTGSVNVLLKKSPTKRINEAKYN